MRWKENIFQCFSGKVRSDENHRRQMETRDSRGKEKTRLEKATWDKLVITAYDYIVQIPTTHTYSMHPNHTLLCSLQPLALCSQKCCSSRRTRFKGAMLFEKKGFGSAPVVGNWRPLFLWPWALLLTGTVYPDLSSGMNCGCSQISLASSWPWVHRSFSFTAAGVTCLAV